MKSKCKRVMKAGKIIRMGKVANIDFSAALMLSTTTNQP